MSNLALAPKLAPRNLVYSGEFQYRIDNKRELSSLLQIAKKFPYVYLFLEDSTQQLQLTIQGEDLNTGIQYIYRSDALSNQLPTSSSTSTSSPTTSEPTPANQELELELDEEEIYPATDPDSAINIFEQLEQSKLAQLKNNSPSLAWDSSDFLCIDNPPSNPSSALSPPPREIITEQPQPSTQPSTQPIGIIEDAEVEVANPYLNSASPATTPSTPTTPTTSLPTDILCISSEIGIINALYVFTEGKIKVEGDDITITSICGSTIHFPLRKSYISEEIIDLATEERDLQNFSTNGFSNILRVLDVMEPVKYKHFVTIDKKRLYSFTDSIFIYSQVKSNLKSKIILNHELIRLVKIFSYQQTLSIGDIDSRHHLLRAGCVYCITGKPQLETDDISEGTDFDKRTVMFELNPDLYKKLKLLKSFSKENKVILDIQKDLVTIINDTISTSTSTNSTPSGKLIVDLDMILSAYNISNSKRAQVSSLTINGSEVLIVSGQISSVIKLDGRA